MPVGKRNIYENIWQSLVKSYQTLEEFEQDLINFHINQRTPIRQLPNYVLGKKLDLQSLFINVIKRGGYRNVNTNGKWDEIVEEMQLLTPLEDDNSDNEDSVCCINAGYALQMLYSRYLELYERWKWSNLSNGSTENGYITSLNNSNDESNNSDIDLSKHSNTINELSQRDKSFMAQYMEETVAKVYKDRQHLVASSQREEYGLDIQVKPLYEMEKLRWALLSGLTNEIELAVNTLLIMSTTQNNAGLLMHLMPEDLPDLLSSCVGVTNSDLGQQFLKSNWMKDMLQFWYSNIDATSVGQVFLIPNIFDCSKSQFEKLSSNPVSHRPISQLFDNQLPLSHNPIYNRISAVLTIVYNCTLSHIANRRYLAHYPQLLRLLLLSSYTQHHQLRVLALQTLSRLHLVLNQDSVDDDDESASWFTQFILSRFLVDLLNSADRADRISAHELIQTLCLIEDNHQIISDGFTTQLLIPLTSHLIIPDIHPICTALETFVALSQLGEVICRRMALITSLLRILLQYIQIEAQIFGPSAVYRIRTFNHRPPSAMNPNNQIQQAPPPQLRLPSYNPNLVNSTSPLTSTHNIAPPSLSPLQHINNLLNKSFNSSLDKPQSPNQQASSNTTTSPQHSNNERKIVKIKCFQEPNSYSNSEINNNYSTTSSSTCTSPGPQVSPTKPSTVSPGQTLSPIPLDNNPLVGGINGYVKSLPSPTSQASPINHDDRTQMPPPSLPPPSILKKQMQLANGIMLTNSQTSSLLSANNIAGSGGGASGGANNIRSLQRQLSSEMTQNSTAMIEYRLSWIKRWLYEHYAVESDSKSFVTKHELVSALHTALGNADITIETDSGRASSRSAGLSAHELHNCIKEVFGTTVQVKVEHSLNGTSQLIYSHLTKKISGSEDSCVKQNGQRSLLSNGFIHPNVALPLPAQESHVVVNGHCHTNGNGTVQTKSKPNGVKTRLIDKYRRTNTNLQIKYIRRILRRHKKLHYKQSKRLHSKQLSKEESQQSLADLKLQRQHPVNHQITNNKLSTELLSASIQCCWDKCGEMLANLADLQRHLSLQHLPVSDNNGGELPRKSPCLWQHCNSSPQLMRAPLSLLGHILEVHCCQNSTSNILNQQHLIANNRYSLPPSSPLLINNSTIASTSSPVLTADKSGWSVVYDQFRLEQTLLMQQQLPEGPLTRHIRISAALVLRNMARQSLVAKQFLQRHQANLVAVAISNQDCSPIIVQCLDELDNLITGTTTDLIDASLSLDSNSSNFPPSSIQSLIMTSFKQLLNPY